ncbi:hypothetical protein J1N35_037589 [Gossypium stocksii]|uniref:DUF4283 domain-containing protein n=1 Tax=Gossypium stocksii TaxID=47602 RepID=A0A9D3ZM09_9ROSI|nr:hypothetical protein J1N35_037589 [Gossypium stocksii]
MDDQGYEAWAIGKDEEFQTDFNMVPFWIWIYNIPFEQLNRQVAVDIGGVLRELVAIDWRDRKGCWIKYIRIRVKTDVSKPLRRVIKMVGLDGIEILCTRERGNKMRNKRKNGNGHEGEGDEESSVRLVRRILLDDVSPFKAGLEP